MKKKPDVKKNLLDHSQAKVKLLGEYLKRYLSIITNDGYTKSVKMYDLFCGEGLYEDGGEGSPLVTMRQINEVQSTNSSRLGTFPKIDCHFNDIDKDKITKVNAAINEKQLHLPENGEVEFSNADYQVKYEEIQKLLPGFRSKDQKAFIFIDPYEYKHIKASQIKNLMATGSAEVLLWLPTQFMYRFTSNGTPEALKDFISEIIPDFKSWKPGNVWNFISELKRGFQSFLGQSIFVDTFTIQKDSSTVFCLFFFTSHIRGFEKMLEAKWEIDTEEGRGWEYSGNGATLFSEHKTNPLEESLNVYLSEGKRSNDEVYEFTLRQGFLPTHTNEIFKFWQKEGKIDVLLEYGQQARKGAFYINYNGFKNEKKKVTYKLK